MSLRALRRNRRKLDRSVKLVRGLRSEVSALRADMRYIKKKEAEYKKAVMESYSVIASVASLTYRYSPVNPSLAVRKIKDVLGVAGGDDMFPKLYFAVNLYCDGALDELKARYPRISDKDIQLCCLLCFGFDVSAICSVYGESMTPNNVYQRRNRLKKTFGMEGGFEIERFLAELSASAYSAAYNADR